MYMLYILYMYISICVCVYRCVCIYVCVYVCVYMYAQTRRYKYITYLSRHIYCIHTQVQ